MTMKGIEKRENQSDPRRLKSESQDSGNWSAYRPDLGRLLRPVVPPKQSVARVGEQAADASVGEGLLGV